jgi:hypothetical protein
VVLAHLATAAAALSTFSSSCAVEELTSGTAADVTTPFAHDNSKFANDNTAQGLTVGSIRQLQHRGVIGKDLITEIARGSATFAARSEFSKEKWLKSKMRKYVV